MANLRYTTCSLFMLSSREFVFVKLDGIGLKGSRNE